MTEIAQAIVSVLGGAALLIIAVGCLFGEQIFLLLAIREVRKMAATMPEKDRERWLDDALGSMGEGVKKARKAQ